MTTDIIQKYTTSFVPVHFSYSYNISITIVFIYLSISLCIRPSMFSFITYIFKSSILLGLSIITTKIKSVEDCEKRSIFFQELLSLSARICEETMSEYE